MGFKHLKSHTTVSEDVNKFVEVKKNALKIQTIEEIESGTRYSIKTDEWSSSAEPRNLINCA